MGLWLSIINLISAFLCIGSYGFALVKCDKDYMVKFIFAGRIMLFIAVISYVGRFFFK